MRIIILIISFIIFILYCNQVFPPKKVASCFINATDEALFEKYKTPATLAKYSEYQKHIKNLAINNEAFKNVQLIEHDHDDHSRLDEIRISNTSCITTLVNKNKEVESIVYLSSDNKIKWEDAYILEIILEPFHKMNKYYSNDIYKIANNIDTSSTSESEKSWFNTFQNHNNQGLYVVNKQTQNLSIFFMEK